ncbi:MAG: ComEC/Rec2 family competence protein [Candidatus Liptonbacteria bacterium]|nr:ComEC/Rec2 family competence protein [Candidatus Liptonbacteria bacterium]
MPPHAVAFGAALSAIGGIALGTATDARTAILVAFFAWAAVMCVRMLFPAAPIRAFAFGAIACVGIGYGVISEVLNKTTLPIGRPVALSGRIASDVQSANGRSEFRMRLFAPQRGTVTVYTEREDVSFGDVIEMRGVPKRSAYGRVYVSAPEIIARTPSRSKIRAALFAVKHAVIGVFDRTLPADHAALISGILLGARGGFSPALSDAMRNSGTMHIVALSGYNISVIVGMLSIIGISLLPTGVGIIFIILTLTGFVIMTGAEESLVRAGIMGGLAFIAHRTGALYGMGNAIAFALLAMLVWNPAVIRSLGLQLSFAALLGIVYIRPAVERLLHANGETPSLFRWRDHAATTIAAQAGALPVIAAAFHVVSLTGVAANVLIIGTIPFVMLFGAVGGVIGLISLPIALPFLWITHGILWYEIVVIRIFGSISPITL